MTESFTLCINGERYFHRSLTKTLHNPLDLIAWLNEQKELPKCYWHGRDGREVAAFGSVLTLNTVPRFDRDNDSPARFWGGHAFFPSSAPKDDTWRSFPRSAFFLPKYELHRHGKTFELIINAINAPLPEECVLANGYFSKGSMSLKRAAHLPTSKNWQELIEISLEKIESELLKKVVMGRRSTHVAKEKLNALELLSSIREKQSIRFAFQFSPESTFIGATPERLYKRIDRQILTEAIAGTRPLGKENEKELREDPKEQREFAYVKTSIAEALSPLCETLSASAEDTIVKTSTVQHLHSTFEGNLLLNVQDSEILSALHPSAAMGGLPKPSALEHLLNHEPFERGWYASPLGFISEHEAEFAVGIRSALVEENRLHLFAAAGIVAGSTADKEWQELQHKIAHWIKL